MCVVLVVVAPLSSCLPLSLSSVLNPPCVAGFAQGVWSTPPYNEKKLNKAYRVCDAPHMHTTSHITHPHPPHITHIVHAYHTQITHIPHTPPHSHTTHEHKPTHMHTCTHRHICTYLHVQAHTTPWHTPHSGTHHTVAHTTPWHTPTHAV